MPWYNPNVITSIPAKFADGTAAAPSITFTSDTTEGIFKPAASTIGFSIGGVEAARIGAGQILGVAGAVGAPSYSYIGETATGFYKNAVNQTTFAALGVNQFTLFNGGVQNFGIRSTGQVIWSATDDSTGAADTGIKRNAAGVVEVNSGVAGTFRDLTLRNLTASVQVLTADGTSNAPSLSFSLQATNGFYRNASNQITWASGSNNHITFLNQGVANFAIRSDGQFVWSATTDSTVAPDTGIRRNAGGIVEINNGTAGTFRDFIARAVSAQGSGNSPSAGTTQLQTWTSGFPIMSLVDSAQTVNNRITELLFTGAQLKGRFINDAYNAAVTWLAVTGGQGTGVSSIALTAPFVQFIANAQPDAAGTRDLGLAATGWKRLYIDFTNTATVGNVTINKAAGRVNLAAAGTTLTLTNSLITAASKIMLQQASSPGNAVAVSLSVVPAAGSAVITAVPAVTNQTAIDFVVINAD